MRRAASTPQLAVLVALACAVSTSRARAGASVSAAGGAAFALRHASAPVLGTPWYQLDLEQRSDAAHAWVLRATFARHDLPDPTGATALAVYDGWRTTGGIFLPSDGHDDATTIALGRERRFGSRAFRARVGAFTGAMLVDGEVVATPTPSRRPDPALVNGISIEVHDATPVVLLDAGFEWGGPGALDWSACVGGAFAALRGFDGPIFPITLGVRWPGVARDEARGGPSAARLRLAAGSSVIREPRRIRDEMDPGLAVAAELELPLLRWLSFSIAAEQATQLDDVPIVIRQERDEFGNLVDVYSEDALPVSMTLAAWTAGLRWRVPGARVSPTLRAGAGWGRSGGFGHVREDVSGFYVDEDGNLALAYAATTRGAGRASDGLAWSGALGLEVRFARSAYAFAEAGGLGLVRRGEDAVLLPLRAGFALR